MFYTVCFIENEQYVATPKRTYLLLDNIINIIKISYHDLSSIKANNNKLTLYSKIGSNIIITSSNIKNLYRHIKSNVDKLHYDVNIGDLIIDTDKCSCSICLDENKKDNIIQLKCCNNVFHLKCYTAYVKSRIDYSCPICRNDKLVMKNIQKEKTNIEQTNIEQTNKQNSNLEKKDNCIVI